jgi:lipopolysaccharide export system ATP-binding protein
MISQTAPVSTAKVASLVTTKAETVLTTEELVKIYGGRAVVDGINMHVRASEIVGLLGPNGAGKTTSFYMIVGLVRPNSGHVIFSNTDVTDYPMYKRARLGMGYLPQEEIDFSEDDSGTKHPCDFGNTAVEQGGAAEPLRSTVAPVRH